VKFLGVRRDVSELYQAFDVLALPSKYEGLPVTGIEAQAVGLPTVVSDAVSKETFIVHDLMQSLRLSQPICDWVDALLNSPVGNSRNSGNHERMIEAGYEIQYSANRLCDWYTSLVLN
jgi:glycosyltransferase involved in cell wall biosynthesis